MQSHHLCCVTCGFALWFATSAVSADPESDNLNRSRSVNHLTADGLVAWVLEANPGIAALQAAADATAFRVDPAGSLNDPTLSYGIAPLTASTNRRINQKIEITQTIPWPGTLAVREAAARYDALAADRNVDALRLRVVAQTKAAFAEWRYVHNAMDIHHAVRDLLDKLIHTTQTRYAAGRALKQDVLQAEVERTDLDNRLLHLEKLSVIVLARINALLNRAPNAPLPTAASGILHDDPPALEALQNLALTRHPDLASFDAEILAADNRIELAKKSFYPDFQVGIGYNDLWDDADKRLILGVSVNVPLDQTKRRSELGRAKAEKRRSEFSRTDRLANLLSDVAQARAEVLEAYSSIALYQDKLLPLAAEYLQAVLADYQSGNGNFLNVITAEQRKLAAELALARAQADYATRFAQLERSVGGSFATSGTSSSGDQQ